MTRGISAAAKSNFASLSIVPWTRNTMSGKISCKSTEEIESSYLRWGYCIATRTINIFAAGLDEIRAHEALEKGVGDREIEKVAKALEHQECQRWQEAAIELCNLRS